MFENSPRLETERLILRRFEQSDLKAIYEIYNDLKVNTYLPWFPLKTLEEAKDFYRRNYEEFYKQVAGYRYAICLKENDYPIGYVHVSADESHDFGYGLCEKYWHQGIVSEACLTVLDQIKKDKVPYITATHDIKNNRSGLVMQKIGMKYQYSYEEQWMPKNILVTFRMYQLNLDDHHDYVFMKYWNQYPTHFIEESL